MEDEEEVQEEGQEGVDMVDFEGEEVWLLINLNRNLNPRYRKMKTDQIPLCIQS